MHPDDADLLRYHLLDVFTNTPFAGNPLAVFVDPPELDAVQMQRLAAELNLSETVFVWPPSNGDGWATRIFTPAAELPFAGHPTIGTAVLLGELGLVAFDQPIVLDEPIGPVLVRLDGDCWATLTAAQLPARVDTAAPAALAEAAGLEATDLHPELPPAGWSCGVPFSVVPVRDLDALGRAQVELDAWDRHVADSGADQLYLVTPLDERLERWQVRMFAPGLGIFEDPATGAAASAFAGFLAEHAPAGERWELHQGVEMGRPSLLEVSVSRHDEQLVAVRVSGSAVVVGHGELLVPEGAGPG